MATSFLIMTDNERMSMLTYLTEKVFIKFSNKDLISFLGSIYEISNTIQWTILNILFQVSTNALNRIHKFTLKDINGFALFIHMKWN